MKNQKITTKAPKKAKKAKKKNTPKKAKETVATLGVSLLFLLVFFIGVYYSLGIFAIVS